MSENEVNSILLWAARLADQYELGINIIIDGLMQANKNTKSISEAQAFIENEIKDMGRNKK